jgi:hypothetical protein
MNAKGKTVGFLTGHYNNVYSLCSYSQTNIAFLLASLSVARIVISLVVDPVSTANPKVKR